MVVPRGPGSALECAAGFGVLETIGPLWWRGVFSDAASAGLLRLVSGGTHFSSFCWAQFIGSISVLAWGGSSKMVSMQQCYPCLFKQLPVRMKIRVAFSGSLYDPRFSFTVAVLVCRPGFMGECLCDIVLLYYVRQRR